MIIIKLFGNEEGRKGIRKERKEREEEEGGTKKYTTSKPKHAQRRNKVEIQADAKGNNPMASDAKKSKKVRKEGNKEDRF